MKKIRQFFTCLFFFMRIFCITPLNTTSTDDMRMRANTNELASLFKKMTDLPQTETKYIFKSAEKEVQKLEEKFSQNSKVLEKNAKQQERMLHKEAMQEAKIIFGDYAKETSQLQDKLKEEIRQLKQQAAEKTLELISQAEKDALEVKSEIRQEILQKKLEEFEQKKITQLWRQQLKEQFNKNIEYLKEIISQGETPQEVKDFLQYFDQQLTWFVATLRTITLPTVPKYFQLLQKKMTFDSLVLAQKKVEDAIQKQVNAMTIPLPDYKKIRLIALYETNSVLQQKMLKPIQLLATVKLSQQDVDCIVKKIFTSIQAAPTTLDLSATTLIETKPPIPSDIQKELKEFKRSVTRKIESLSKENLELQTIILEMKQKIGKTVDQADQNNENIRVRRRKKQEKINRNLLEQELTSFLQAAKL